ncbi:MAG: hypothetical protein ACJ8LM_16755, partial [Candidatus Udaeobacter sp.]
MRSRLHFLPGFIAPSSLVFTLGILPSILLHLVSLGEDTHTSPATQILDVADMMFGAFSPDDLIIKLLAKVTPLMALLAFHRLLH